MSDETKVLRKIKNDWRAVIHEVNVLHSIAVDAKFDQDPELSEQILTSAHDGADVNAYIDLGLNNMETYYKNLGFSLSEATEVFGDRINDLSDDFYLIKENKRYPEVIRSQASKLEYLIKDLIADSMEYLTSKMHKN